MGVFEKGLSLRGFEWDAFSDKVLAHVDAYTVPQYGDKGDDMATYFTESDFATQIKKYVARIGSNARGGEEAQRDLLKIAHYCAMLYTKREENAHG